MLKIKPKSASTSVPASYGEDKDLLIIMILQNF
jgi:hypothetical protein